MMASSSSGAGKKPEHVSSSSAWREQPPKRLQPDIPQILPHEKVFPIQIGSELFRLSGASISSDGQYILLLCVDLRSNEKLQLALMSQEVGYLTICSFSAQSF